MNVHMSPMYTGTDQADGGIRRVVEALVRYLPEFGVEIVNDPQSADLCAVHGTLIPPRVDCPMVNHNHGLYWREYAWPRWADGANRSVIDRMLTADAVTAPSEWVANAIRRGSLLHPEVIYHGVESDDWTPEDTRGYVLWNKARADAVSDPEAVGELATRLPAVPFVSTFGAPHDNIQLLGAIPVAQMRHMVAQAGVYLATVRETFGIGTLEALACGVPVVGWRFGGQVEIIREGETGYLVEFGDYDGLAAAIERARADRARLSANARADAIARWGWRPRIAQYADLYQRVLTADRAPRKRTSVVITAHNLNRYLPDAVASAVDQADEVLVVDDCGEQVAQDVLRDWPTVSVHRQPIQGGLSAARNAGAALATGTYLLFLDADDMLAPGALARLSEALDTHRDLHIAAGALDIVGEDGRNARRNPWPHGIAWYKQIAHLNQLHYAALWRRSAFDRTGGYRARHWRAEDASLWTRAMSFGLRAAQVTDHATLIYRMRQDSKSQTEARAYADRDGDWTRDYPWSLGDGTGPGGVVAVERQQQPIPWCVPFAAPGGSPGNRAWPVPHHQEPAVSVIIPVGPGHAACLIDALDSLIAQTVDRWECVVINDTGAPLVLPGHGWARIIATDRIGAGAARNRGAQDSNAPLVLFLDADDMLTPTALYTVLTRYAVGDVAFVYGDCAVVDDKMDQPIDYLPAAEFSAEHWLERARQRAPLGLPAVTMLVARQAFLESGGFDPTLIAWEDGDLYLKLCHQGYLGARVAATILHYRITTGTRRNAGEAQADHLRALLATRYKGADTMARKGSCCGGMALPVARAFDATQPPPHPDAPISLENLPRSGSVEMAYIGDQQGEHSVLGRPSLRTYRVGNNPFHKFFQADAQDVPWLMALGTFALVRPR